LFVTFLASPFFLLCKALGLDATIGIVFVNALAFAVAIGITGYYFRWRSAGFLLVGMLASPLLPFLNKSRGEAFSVSLLAAAAVFLTQGQLLAATLAVSFIAAQVSAFSPLAASLLVYWASRAWTARRRLTPMNFAAVAACLCLLALQPLWMFQEHLPLNQFAATGFDKPELINLTRISGMLIDPDVGLFFRWPLAAVLTLLTIIGLWRGRELTRNHVPYWIFVIGSTVFLSVSASTQPNYTHSVLRDSLWFLPFVLISLILVYERERTKGTLRLAEGIAVVLLGGSAVGFCYAVAVTGLQPSFKRYPQASCGIASCRGSTIPTNRFSRI
jgi:hypothetical protein